MKNVKLKIINKIYVSGALFVAMFPVFVSAHVGYVVDGADLALQKGTDWAYLFGPLSQMKNWGLMIVTAVIAIGLFYILRKRTVVKSVCDEVCQRGSTYAQFYPMLLRMALGIALIGAGSAHVFISPVGDASALIGTIEVALGFLLFLGLATGFTATASLILYVIALIQNPYLFGNLEFFAVGISLLALGENRPGIDHLFGIPFFPTIKKLRPYVPVILRVGLGLAFLYLAVYEKFINPHEAALVVSQYGLDSFTHFGEAMWVLSTGIIELFIALALIVGFMPRLISAIAFVVICGTFFIFQESVYPHVTIFVVLFVIITSGGKHLESNEIT